MLKIDLLAPQDGQRFREIRLRSLQDAPDAFGSTYAETALRPFDSWAEQLAKMPTYVAVNGATDVGVVRGAKDADAPHLCWLLSMWVAPEARGRGVGGALIDAVVAWGIDGGFERMALDVADSNSHAIALYERKGFLPTGEVGSLPPPREHIREHRRVLTLR